MHFHEHPHEHPHQPVMTRRHALQLGGLGLGGILLAACTSSSTVSSSTAAAQQTSTSLGAVDLSTLPGFSEFADTVKVIANGDLWLVESSGLPAHNMMVGITSWQQQVPLAMNYTGTNAWQLPKVPELSDTPISGKTSLFRGAIALAVNGVPIFNALNNRGDDAFLYGELDEWGGHCGRADDYHYHVAPLHLSSVVGDAQPIAYALDGFAIYGANEPNGSALLELDEYNGHVGADGMYHYHGTTTYPYINGGLRGKVAGISGDQIEPQPTTKPIREAGAPLAGAVITNFSSPKTNTYSLEYSQDGKTGVVEYTVSDSSVAFTFTSPTGTVSNETYAR